MSFSEAYLAGSITSIQQQSKNRSRVNVFLDGEFAFGLAKVLAFGLRVGEYLDDTEIDSLTARDEEERAYQRAARWLSQRPQSEYELRRRLSRLEFSAEAQEAVLARFRSSGLVDDQAFAEAWVENRSVFRPRSARMLRAELRQKGVPREAIEIVLEDFDDDQAAYDAARKVSDRWRQLSRDDFRKRLRAYLARRGFNFSTISPVVAQIWEEVAGSESEGFK